MLVLVMYLYLKFTYFRRRLLFIFFATYLVLVPSESSFDKYVCYFSAILVKYMQWNEMPGNKRPWQNFLPS